MKKAILWCWLLTKRLYKKLTYLVILALIPVLVFGYSALTQNGDSGMMTVALAQSQENATVEELFDRLTGSSQLIRYVICADSEAAADLVRTGKADTAWIFPGDFEEAISRFVENPVRRNAIVTVLEREDSVTLMLTREKLSGVLYEHIARELFLTHTRQENPTLPEMTDEEMMTYYLGTDISDQLFTYDEAFATQQQEDSFLLTPVRGMLGVLIVLCGMAAAMYYLHDRQIGTFAWVPERRQLLPELGCQLVAVGNVALVAMVSLALTGMTQQLWEELASLVLYTFAVSLFCMLLRRLLKSQRGLGIAMPLLMVVMLIACPVFFDFAVMRYVQFLLPPTYFVNGVHNNLYLLYMLPYMAITGGACLLYDRLTTK